MVDREDLFDGRLLKLETVAHDDLGYGICLDWTYGIQIVHDLGIFELVFILINNFSFVSNNSVFNRLVLDLLYLNRVHRL